MKIILAAIAAAIYAVFRSRPEEIVATRQAERALGSQQTERAKAVND